MHIYYSGSSSHIHIGNESLAHLGIFIGKLSILTTRCISLLYIYYAKPPSYKLQSNESFHKFKYAYYIMACMRIGEPNTLTLRM